ncbi:hypothetical protein [Halobacteriovorax sp. JY17]|uniref:hypothetical protein n=1 Tax=Halobacteriovorax sp. JY17 TaxID=2014617 RepID=UPI000C636B93|nr:hypothetical protein [Halobacteriovorax sp. JY17]PIK16326.1 MAG: hypothetical protein CES88_06185 [Halobacteriovorax sp. JY17]
MKKVLTTLFIAFSTLSYASDGEYRCDSIQNVSYQDLSSRVLDISYHIDKVKELERNGLRSAALNIVREGLFSIELATKKYKNEKFCYSLSKRAKYQKSLLIKHQIELSLLESELKKFDDCSYAIMKLEEETTAIAKQDEFYGKFLATSKIITKADLIRKDQSCDISQQEKLTQILTHQNGLLSKLYSVQEKS